MTSLKNTTAALMTTLALGAGATTGPASAADAADGVAAAPTVGLWVLLDAKNGREEEVASFLRDGRALVDAEPATTTWFAVRLSETRFAIFDAFPNDAGRVAHLQGKVAAALMAKAPGMLAHAPSIAKVDVLAVKLAPSSR